MYKRQLDDSNQPASVIVVGMGSDDEIERVIPERHLLPQTLQHDRRVAPAVDEHLPPVGGLDERGIPLPHIEEGDVQPAIGALPPPRPGQQDDDLSLIHI